MEKDLSGKYHYSFDSKETSYLEHPLYCISTRDSFAYDLIKNVEFVIMNGRKVRKYTLFIYD